MTHIVSVKGLLTSNDPGAVTSATGELVEEAVNISGLQGVLTKDKDNSWQWGILIVDSLPEEKLTLFQLVAMLSQLTHEEGIKELGLDGFLQVTVDAEPSTYRIRVWDGNVGYEQIP